MGKGKFWRIKEIFLVFCSLISYGFKEPDYCRLSKKIFWAYNKTLQQEKGLYLERSGGGFMHDVELICASYISFEAMNVDQARRLYVEVVEGYLKRYNADEQIRPYLHDYPFTFDNLRIMFGFEDEFRKPREGGIVGMICKGKGHKIHYCTFDKETGHYEDIHSELYEEAQEIVLGKECP